MRVISASRRTDVPAFYSEWFMNRIRAGYCHWMNPYTSQVFRVSLAPEDVIAIAFWTRNAAPLLPHLKELDEKGYRYYFMVTVLGYSRPLESHNPSLDAAVRTFQALSKRLGPDRVFWRYDPIVVSDVTPPEYHLQRFQTIAQRLKGYTQRCIYSFLDMYGKTSRNLADIKNVNVYALEGEARYSLVKQLLDIAYLQDMQLQTCCEEDYQAVSGLVRGRCVDIDVLRNLTGDPENWGCRCDPPARCAAVWPRRTSGCMTPACLDAGIVTPPTAGTMRGSVTWSMIRRTRFCAGRSIWLESIWMKKRRLLHQEHSHFWVHSTVRRLTPRRCCASPARFAKRGNLSICFAHEIQNVRDQQIRISKSGRSGSRSCPTC